MDVYGIEGGVALWIPLTLLLLVLLYIYGTYPMSTWKRVGVPGPDPAPFVGTMLQTLDRKLGTRGKIQMWQKLYGRIIGVYYFRKPCLIVTDAELLKRILVKEFDTFPDRYIIGGEKFIPKPVLDGVAQKSGSEWRRIRRIMTPCFTAGKLKLLTGYINQTSRQLGRKLLEHAEMGTDPEARDTFGAYSLDVIAGTGFGLNLDSQKKSNNCEIFKNIQGIFHPKKFFKLALFMVGSFPITGTIFKKLNISVYGPEAIQFFKDLFGKLVLERKNFPEHFKQADFFQLLLKAEMDEADSTPGETKLTQDEIVCQGIMLIMSGYQTTSATLQYLSHILATNHSVQDKIIQEIEETIGEDSDEVTLEQSQKLKYTEAVILETLRMYPPILALRREVVKDTSLNGFPVKAGSGIIVPIFNIGHDPEYFDDPDRFIPERFLGENSTSNPIHFLSFGFGPRQCIGMRLAMLEMKTAIVHMLKKVYIEDATPRTLDIEDYTGYLVPKVPFTIKVRPA